MTLSHSRRQPAPIDGQAEFPQWIALTSDGEPPPTTRTALRRLRQSLVIPTFNERDNIAPLLRRLSTVLPPSETEVIFVDDSTDDTPQVIAAAGVASPIPVRMHHRGAADGGLGGAVVEGFRRARGSWIVVMDGDLQHPPEAVPDLVRAGERDGADLVVATRYLVGGSRAGLADGYRQFVSAAATRATKMLFWNALSRVSDPMSGFFAVRRSSLEAQALQPLGYKILLELLVRTRPARIVEVPYTFETRHAGESKSSLSEGVRFLRHLARLRLTARASADFRACGDRARRGKSS